ncbi:hypothetical protein CCP3SC5AM1_130003 [Gammaproteobacteria bacterium]
MTYTLRCSSPLAKVATQLYPAAVAGLAADRFVVTRTVSASAAFKSSGVEEAPQGEFLRLRAGQAFTSLQRSSISRTRADQSRTCFHKPRPLGRGD